MSTIFSALVVFGCLLLGASSVLQYRRTTSVRARSRHLKFAIGAFGSVVIMGLVTLLGETVQTLVIIAAVFWLARHLYRGTSPWVRFVEKKVAQML